MKVKDRLFKKLAYRYSKERVEQIEAIDREIERCESDIWKTQQSDYFSCSWYGARNIVTKKYEIQSDIMERIILVGLKKYKEELINKKNKLL